MRNYVQAGNTITVGAPRDLASGDGCLVGALFGVSAYDVELGDDAELETVGVFTLPKAAGAVPQGAALYWNDTARTVTTDDGDVRIGVCVVPAASGDPTITVRLNGSF